MEIPFSALLSTLLLGFTGHLFNLSQPTFELQDAFFIKPKSLPEAFHPSRIDLGILAPSSEPAAGIQSLHPPQPPRHIVISLAFRSLLS